VSAILPSGPGTYALLIHIPAPLTLHAGGLGEVRFRAGTYVYIGSAHGPGGLRARVDRHRRAEKKRRWHIDYLTTAAPVVRVWAAVTGQRLECALARAVRDLPGTAIPARGFGASDCACPAHLFHVPDPEAVCPALQATTAADVLLY
jgi:Uri superfamily endonuclease